MSECVRSLFIILPVRQILANCWNYGYILQPHEYSHAVCAHNRIRECFGDSFVACKWWHFDVYVENEYVRLLKRKDIRSSKDPLEDLISFYIVPVVCRRWWRVDAYVEHEYVRSTKGKDFGSSIDPWKIRYLFYIVPRVQIYDFPKIHFLYCSFCTY